MSETTRELAVETVVAGGEGLAREAGGRVVFVPRTAPGDRVRVRLTEEHRSWARGRPVALLRAGAGRRAPPCPYYARCGGCQLQHLREEVQRRARKGIVEEGLQRIGKLDRSPDALVAAGPAFGYRSRVAFTLRRKAGEQTVAGYHRWDDPEGLVDIADCPLAEPAIRGVWRTLRAAWGEGAAALPAGEELRLVLQSSERGEVHLLVEAEGPVPAGGAERLVAAVPGLRGVHLRAPEGEPRRLAGERTLRERRLGLRLALEPGVFLQVNREVFGRLEVWLDRMAGPVEGRRVADLYAGVGLRALRWAARGASAVACERQSAAVRAGREAARIAGLPVRFLEGDVEERFPECLPADLMVVNPPRAGLSADARRALREAAHVVGRLVYVSCDPATLGRDLSALAPAWRPGPIRAFDAFPQTAHVETVVLLHPAEGSGR